MELIEAEIKGKKRKVLQLQVDGTTLNVLPLKYKKSKLFAERLEKVDLSRREQLSTSSGWTFLYQSADIVVDMLVAATGRTQEEVEDSFELADAADWLLYLQHGPEVIEKKMALTPTMPTT